VVDSVERELVEDVAQVVGLEDERAGASTVSRPFTKSRKFGMCGNVLVAVTTFAGP